MERPRLNPAPGSRILRHVGDRLRVDLEGSLHPGARAFLRTNLTRGSRARAEVVALAGRGAADPGTFAGASWRDIPLERQGDRWSLDLPLTEPGHFRAKAYLLDPEGRQHWPEGEDLGISVLPDGLRTANTIYCAFPRLFGPTRTLVRALREGEEHRWQELDRRGLTVIPPSGTLRDLAACVPHIVDTLGFRILHLLPLGPTPTTYARMGRFGSPYAQLDLEGIDPALVVFDRRSTAEDQFRELAHAVHAREALVFLDIVVNHTGWGSRLMQEAPEGFRREPGGAFRSPGAWGVTWGDLVELDHQRPELWTRVADSLLTWCRRGVDGFRCDAGYMIPLPAWQYIAARVRQEFPETVFLLEGLGGAWETTEALLAEGSLTWAYSELFQNHAPRAVSGYLDHALRQAQRLGPLVHYAETHDNDRLARRGRVWSLLRNRLCALASVSGAWGLTCGVEWLAPEKIDVHQATGLAWGSEDNLVPELAALNRLVSDHPCFFDGARIERLSGEDDPVLVLQRTSAEGLDACLVVVNLDPDLEHTIRLPEAAAGWVDLLGQPPPEGAPTCTLAPGAAFALAPAREPRGLSGEAYRRLRAQAAFGFTHLAEHLGAEGVGPLAPETLAAFVEADPSAFLAALPRLDRAQARIDAGAALRTALKDPGYPAVALWEALDARRVRPVPPGHSLLVREAQPFTAILARPGRTPLRQRSTPVSGGQVAAFPPSAFADLSSGGESATLTLERFQGGQAPLEGTLRLLAPDPLPAPGPAAEGLVLLTNGRGAMARVHTDLGRIASKYDALLAANLHPEAPCDRHVLVKRLRAWANADGFLSSLEGAHLLAFQAGPPARWTFRVPAGDGRAALLRLELELQEGHNTVRVRLERLAQPPSSGDPLPPEASLRVTLRFDLEDRSFHQETRCSDGQEAFFRRITEPLAEGIGFTFAPAEDRRLRGESEAGRFHLEPEWSRDLHHSVEAQRGMADRGDAWSPGWFEIELAVGRPVRVQLSADPEPPPLEALREPAPGPSDLREALRRSASAFLARRGPGLTVIAGYPWFLDWGRDTLIACRGLLAGGFEREARSILRTFGAFEDRGTLPNMLGADSTANRSTSDAPLWFALACEDAARRFGPAFLQERAGDRTLAEVLDSIARGYRDGTPNGIRMDPASGLIWSPAHFTWMDTNFPACTPREGYPIELQGLWIRLLRQVAALEGDSAWTALADRAQASLGGFWDEAEGWCHDTLLAPAGTPAAQARPDGHLRPNQLWVVALGLLEPARARRVVAACERHLLVPGALRSLAPLPVREPLPLRGPGGQPLNDPRHPYWGRYEGDEDTRRKPAYHNGTAWCWLLPLFAEALAKAWPDDATACAAARAHLGSCAALLAEGCLGHLPEILDGDAPHAQRGCDAQAWSATEALRIWVMLESCP